MEDTAGSKGWFIWLFLWNVMGEMLAKLRRVKRGNRIVLTGNGFVPGTGTGFPRVLLLKGIPKLQPDRTCTIRDLEIFVLARFRILS